MKRTPFLAITIFFALLLAVGVATAQSTTPPSNTVNIQFVSHLQAKLPEQDVFIEGGKSNEVVRVEEKMLTTPRALKVYATATTTQHDPFKVGPHPLGPFTKGRALGFTLGQWLAATGSGTYTAQGDNSSMNLSFQKLVPNSTYTIWCSRVTFPPNPKVEDYPCGADDGSQNTFKADAQANGIFNLTNFKALPESTKETATMIALAYHSDGKTHGANPGEFGLNSHVQVFFPIPAPTTQATISPTSESNPPAPARFSTIQPTTSPASSGTTGLWGWLVLIVIVVILAIAFFSRGSSAS